MKPGSEPPYFDPGALREAAGDKVFARGAGYFENGHVEIIGIEEGRLFARVLGSTTYRVRLDGRHGDIRGTCTCPAHVKWSMFCKHLVAAALAANAADAASAAKHSSRFDRMRSRLRAMGTDALVEKLIALAMQDDALLDDLELFATAASGSDDDVLASLTEAVKRATQISSASNGAGTRGWARNVQAILDQIERLVGDGRARIALTLLDGMFARLQRALLASDDSSGEGHAAFCRAADIHLVACKAINPDPIELARRLYRLEVGCPWDIFDAASDTYADVLGDTGITEYRRLAETEWRKITRRRANRSYEDDAAYIRHGLKAIVERFAEQDGDIDALVSIRSQALSSPYDHADLARFCMDHGRDAEALYWAEEGLRRFKRDPDEHLVVFAAELYQRAARHREAEKLLWNAFRREPSEGLYRRLRAADGASSTAVREKALAALRQRIVRSEKGWLDERPQLVELLVRLLLTEGLLSDAWDEIRRHDYRGDLLETFAEARAAGFPAQAAEAYALRIEQLVVSGGRDNYEHTWRLVERAGRIRGGPGAKADHAAYVRGLLDRHKKKRAFIQLQPTAAARTD